MCVCMWHMCSVLCLHSIMHMFMCCMGICKPPTLSSELRLPTEMNKTKRIVLSEELIKIKQNMVMGHESQ